MQSLNRFYWRPSRAAMRWSTAALVAIAPAVQATEERGGYLVSEGDRPVIAADECVHTSQWREGMRLARCEPPQPVAAVPQSKPQPAPVTEAPTPRAVPFRLSADTLFDHDSTTLKPEGSAALDALAEKIANSTYQTVRIIGHADRTGTASYNLGLSERRAKVVGAHLAARGIDSSRISTRGVGTSAPATAPGQCDRMRGQQLIDCLQPDRFAEVDVDGTAQQASTSTGDRQ